MSSSQAPPYNVLYAAGFDLAANTFVSGVTWGFMTSLYAACMYNLVRNLRSAQRTNKTALLTVWITVLWTSSSLSTIANAYCYIYAYIWKMDYPGEAAYWLTTIWNQPVPALAYTTYLLTMWFADAMMLWRLFIFYDGAQPLARGLILSFMTLIYIGVVGAGCFTLVINSSNVTLYSKLARRAAIPCFTLSVTLNVFATSFIAIRLLQFKRLTEKTLGLREARASPYTGVAAMLIESSALYATWSLLFIILYAVNSPGQTIMLMTLCNVQVIAPTLIVYRVSRGMGWDRSTSAKLMSSRFVSDSRGKSHTMLGSEVRDSEYLGLNSGVKKMVFADPTPVESKTSYSSSR